MRKTTVVLSVFLLLLSFTQPAYLLKGGIVDSLSSIMLFFLGWMGFLGGAWESLLWIANPLYLLSIYLLLKQKKQGVICSALPVLLAIAFSQLPTYLLNESGTRTTMALLLCGYKLWLSGFIVLFIGTVANLVITSQKPHATT